MSVVLEDHPQAGHGLGPGPQRHGRRREGHVQPLPGRDPVGLGRQAAADQNVARADQLGRGGPGQAEHPGQRGVQALAVQAVRHGHPALARAGPLDGHRPWPGPGSPAWPAASSASASSRSRSRWPSRRDAASGQQDGQDAAADDGRVGQVEDGPVRQLDPVDHVAAEQAGAAEDPVDQVAAGPAEQQAQRQRPGQAADASRGAQDQHDHADRDGREHDGQRGADAERGAGVARYQQLQEAARQPHRRLARQPGHHQQLGDDVQGQHGHGHADQDPDPRAPGSGGRLRGAG